MGSHGVVIVHVDLTGILRDHGLLREVQAGLDIVLADLWYIRLLNSKWFKLCPMGLLQGHNLLGIFDLDISDERIYLLGGPH